MSRKALLIGVNEYENVTPLRGCGNDVFNMSLVLKEWAGFDTMEVRAVADDRATKDEIRRRIEWLVKGAKSGDLLVLHFSGHGAQVRDRDGETDELEDGLDEVLCPYDMDWDEHYISDDYLQETLQVPDGVVLEVILDACHSGQGSTQVGFPGARPSSDDPDRQPRFVAPPVDVLIRHTGSQLPVQRLFRSAARASTTVLWSSCAEFQTAADARINGNFNGAFTFYFCEHLRQSQGAMARAELLRRVRNSLSENGYSQTPELSAPASLKGARVFSL
jgi:metacaspase-1